MSKSERIKGLSFERKIRNHLADNLGDSFNFYRNLEQSRNSDQGDILSDDADWPFVVECKKYKSGSLCQPAWWRQAQKAADKLCKFPVVIYQYDRKPIRCVLSLSVIAVSCGDDDCDSDTLFETSLDGFYEIARELLAQRAKQRSIELAMERINGV